MLKFKKRINDKICRSYYDVWFGVVMTEWFLPGFEPRLCHL